MLKMNYLTLLPKDLLYDIGCKYLDINDVLQLSRDPIWENVWKYNPKYWKYIIIRDILGHEDNSITDNDAIQLQDFYLHNIKFETPGTVLPLHVFMQHFDLLIKRKVCTELAMLKYNDATFKALMYLNDNDLINQYINLQNYDYLDWHEGLIGAIMGGHMARVKSIIADNSNLNFEYALEIAVQFKQLEIITLLVTTNASNMINILSNIISNQNPQEQTEVIIALIKNHTDYDYDIDNISDLLQNVIDHKYNDLLDLFLTHKFITVMDILYIDLSYYSRYKQLLETEDKGQLLDLATINNDNDMIITLINDGATDFRSALISASEDANLDLIKFFVNHIQQHEPTQALDNVNAAASSAAFCAQIDVVKYLITLGANDWSGMFKGLIWYLNSIHYDFVDIIVNNAIKDGVTLPLEDAICSALEHYDKKSVVTLVNKLLIYQKMTSTSVNWELIAIRAKECKSMIKLLLQFIPDNYKAILLSNNSSNIQTYQCSGITQSGSRCTRTSTTTFCWQHQPKS